MYSAKQPRYQRVSQLEDDSDGEVVLYTHKKAAERFGNGVYNENLDLELPSSPTPVKERQRRVLQAAGFLLAFLVVLCVVLALAVLVLLLGKHLLSKPTASPPIPTTATSLNTTTAAPPSQLLPTTSSPPETEAGSPSSSVSWERMFEGSGTEASLQLSDLNEDGILDVVTILSEMDCLSSVAILDGQTGSTLWEQALNFECFAVRCDLDVTGDGRVDCLACGRDGGFLALDGRDGSIVWVVDPIDAVPLYNFYYPLIVRDLDGDGVRDLVNVHGGDVTYRPDDLDRSPGFLLVVSGRTGQQLTSAMLMPDGRETYMSPVLFSIDGDTEVVLIGSGGETVPGSLWAVTMDSIQDKVHQNMATSGYSSYHKSLDDTRHNCYIDEDLDYLRPSFNQSLFQPERAADVVCPEVPGGVTAAVPNGYQLCVYKLLSGKEKGVLLPPVVADMTGDGVDDLVVSLFEGYTRLLDGRDLSVVWNHFLPNTESYSLPVPLHFNEDATLDLLVRGSSGAWPEYTGSELLVLDGGSGEVLWNFPTSKAGMASPVVMAANTPGYDVMVFISVSSSVPTSSKEFTRSRRHGDDKNMLTPEYDNAEEEEEEEEDTDPPNIWQSAAGDEFPDPVKDFDKFLSYCLEINTNIVDTSLFALNRHLTTHSTVKPLHSNTPYFSMPEDFDRQSSSGEQPRERRHGQDSATKGEGMDAHRLRCAHLAVPRMVVATPALGDIDADGRLEVVYAVVWAGSDFEALPNLPPRMLVKALTIEEAMRENGEEILDFSRFLPGSQQPWPRYMGATGDSVYRSPP